MTTDKVNSGSVMSLPLTPQSKSNWMYSVRYMLGHPRSVLMECLLVGRGDSAKEVPRRDKNTIYGLLKHISAITVFSLPIRVLSSDAPSHYLHMNALLILFSCLGKNLQHPCAGIGNLDVGLKCVLRPLIMCSYLW